MKNIFQYALTVLLLIATTSCRDNENWRIIPYEPEETTVSVLYVVGNHQGWKPDAEVIGMIYSTEDDGIYTGYAFLNGEFKCTSEQNWDGTNYGSGGDGILSTEGSAGNINAPEGYYWLEFDTNALTYTLTPANWGVIGDATPGGWDSDTDLVYNPESLKLEVEMTLTDGTIKFRANDGWDLNYGGSLEELSAGGDNISVTAGTYQVVLDLSTPEYKPELIKK